MNQQYIEDIKNIEKYKQSLKKLAKPVLGFLSEEQPDAVDPIKTKLDSLGEQIFRWVIMMHWGSANLSPVIVNNNFSRLNMWPDQTIVAIFSKNAKQWFLLFLNLFESENLSKNKKNRAYNCS